MFIHSLLPSHSRFCESAIMHAEPKLFSFMQLTMVSGALIWCNYSIGIISTSLQFLRTLLQEEKKKPQVILWFIPELSERQTALKAPSTMQSPSLKGFSCLAVSVSPAASCLLAVLTKAHPFVLTALPQSRSPKSSRLHEPRHHRLWRQFLTPPVLSIKVLETGLQVGIMQRELDLFLSFFVFMNKISMCVLMYILWTFSWIGSSKWDCAPVS